MQMRHFLKLPLLVLALAACAGATVYRVGPDEEYSRISEVAPRLRAGDVVEVTGDITDSFRVTASGSAVNPITIRGITRVENGRIVRPKVSIEPHANTLVLSRGDWLIFEGLAFDGKDGGFEGRTSGLRHDGDFLTLRNCSFRYFSHRAISSAPEAGSIKIEFCEFDSNGRAPHRHIVDIWSFTSGSTMTVEHCWFRDGTGGALLRSRATRNVIRYNWFENPYITCLSVVGPMEWQGQEDSYDHLYPMHTDIVGNVFFQGWSPGTLYAVMMLGGEEERTPGTEGDFHIAHNLFVSTRTRTKAMPADQPPAVHLRVFGNVDRVIAYNNVFLEYGACETGVYISGVTWDTPRTRAFQQRRGHGEPVVEGANNWVSAKSTGIPEGFLNTLSGINPHFVDLVNFDFRPTRDSPLAGTGAWPLPEGRIVELVPEYEPQRGIPADLSPRRRRRAVPPSIGPFEAAE